MDGETFEPDEIGPPYTHFVEDKISYKGKKYKLAHNCAQKDIAARLGIDESKVSKILHHRIEGFSTDSLISLYEKLDPNVRLKVG